MSAWRDLVVILQVIVLIDKTGCDVMLFLSQLGQKVHVPGFFCDVMLFLSQLGQKVHVPHHHPFSAPKMGPHVGALLLLTCC